MKEDLDGLKPLSCTEAFRWLAAKRTRTEWGCWKYHPENLTLECGDERGFIYEVDLERCSTSAGGLDWVFQVHRKRWATAEIVKDLLTALDDLLNPQGTLCSFGRSSTINPREILRSRDARGERVPVTAE
jgi:hypothetical protein